MVLCVVCYVCNNWYRVRDELGKARSELEEKTGELRSKHGAEMAAIQEEVHRLEEASKDMKQEVMI